VFVDEAGFYLLPMAVRTYAPRGETPLLRVPLTRDHWSAISGITPQGKLYMMVQTTAFAVLLWCVSCAISCATFPERFFPSGMAGPLIMARRSKPFSLKGRRSASIWNGCPATRPT
jgi:hypothetical protein